MSLFYINSWNVYIDTFQESLKIQLLPQLKINCRNSSEKTLYIPTI